MEISNNMPLTTNYAQKNVSFGAKLPVKGNLDDLIAQQEDFLLDQIGKAKDFASKKVAQAAYSQFKAAEAIARKAGK